VVVARQLFVAPSHPLVVAHAGYGAGPKDYVARSRIMDILQGRNHRTITVENIPAIMLDNKTDLRALNTLVEMYFHLW